MKNPIHNRLPLLLMTALLLCFSIATKAQQVDKPVQQERVVKENTDVLQKKKYKASTKAEKKAQRVAQKNRKKVKKTKREVHKPGKDGHHTDADVTEKTNRKKASVAQKANGHAYGKNKGKLSNKNFGQARSKAARAKNGKSKRQVKKLNTNTTVE